MARRHRERAEARGGQVVLHPVLTEFQGLIDTDPVVRMYVNQIIAQVPGAKPYRMIDSKVTPGYHVGKGEELGYFQYGGSTHCLVFRPGAIAEFALAAIPSRTTPRRRG